MFMKVPPFYAIELLAISVSQSPTLNRIDKVKHYIKIKIYNTIILKFWYKTGVKCLIYIILMSYNYMEPQSLNIIITITHIWKIIYA